MGDEPATATAPSAAPSFEDESYDDQSFDDAGDHPDLAAEQRYLDAAYDHLAHMRVRAAAAADEAAAQADDWNAAVALHQLEQRLRSIDRAEGSLCFGRLDHDDGERLYVGRRHVEDRQGDPVVVDWRAPVSVPFYRATFRDPMGLHRRRRFATEGRSLVGIFDEHLDDPEASGGGGGVPDPLLAELDRARTGTMRDIVSTIQAEQDTVIRAPLDRVVVVQGGPGTGKTAVGLHRAAFLLYEHRDVLERDGVLVVGPNPVFLRYISQVLPSLGETAVTQTTILGLLGRYRVRATEPAAVAALKGHARMARVIAAACRDAIRRPDEPLRARTRWGTTVLGADELGLLLDAALAPVDERGRAVGLARDAFRGEVHRTIQARLSRPDGDFVDRDVLATDLRADATFTRGLDRLWPRASGAAVVRRLLTSKALLGRAAEGVLDPSEQAALLRKAGPSMDAELWTEADIPLLDEAEAVINGAPRRFGHIVVDEAQDLSAMALRMLARRAASVPSLTVLGDLAQSTSPGGQSSWDDAIVHLGRPTNADVEELPTGYRVPAQILAFANRLLPIAAPGVRPSTSVRATTEDPQIVPVPPGDDLGRRTAHEVIALATRYSSIGVVAPDELAAGMLADLRAGGIPAATTVHAPGDSSVTVLTPRESKGLEFDAVVVVEPGAVFDAGPAGPRLLYVAMTRAVQHLTVVHAEPLPAVLAA